MDEKETNENETNEIPEIKSENQNQVKNEDLPTHPVEIIKMRKSGGLTIPKKIREELKENEEDIVNFAFWKEGNKLIFLKVKEYEIPDLKIKGAESKTKNTETKAKKSPSKKKISKKSGPQPEITNYFPFQIQNQEKIANALESTFYKLTEDPPKIEEAIERIKYVLINYSTGNNTNDSRLKNTIIIFLVDIFKKVNDPSLHQLLDYVNDKIVNSIASKYLKEQALIQLVSLAISANHYEMADQLSKNILIGISEYTEPYAIMQGFKGLVKSLVNIQHEIPEKVQLKIKNEIEKYIFSAQNPYIFQKEDNNDYEKEIVEEISVDNPIDCDNESDESSKDEIPIINEEEIEIDENEEELKESSEIIEADLGKIPTNEINSSIKPYPQLSTDNSIELVDLLKDLHMIEDAFSIIKRLQAEIPTDDIYIDQVRKKVLELRKENI